MQFAIGNDLQCRTKKLLERGSGDGANERREQHQQSTSIPAIQSHHITSHCPSQPFLFIVQRWVSQFIARRREIAVCNEPKVFDIAINQLIESHSSQES
jgi:hypothetical protein